MNSSLTELSNEYMKTVAALDEQIKLKKRDFGRARRKGFNRESAELHDDLVLLRSMRDECYEIALYLKNYYVKGEMRHER